MLPQCTASAVVLPPLCSGQARGPPQGRVRATGETPQVRPVAVGGIERRLFCATVGKQAAPYFAAWLGPHQVAVGVSASAEKLAFCNRNVPNSPAVLDRAPARLLAHSKTPIFGGSVPGAPPGQFSPHKRLHSGHGILYDHSPRHRGDYVPTAPSGRQMGHIRTGQL